MKLTAYSPNHINKYYQRMHQLWFLIKTKKINYVAEKYLGILGKCFHEQGMSLNEGIEYQNRNRFIKEFIKTGYGIEIGALHHPAKVRRGVKVKYVDRLNIEMLRQHYPELNKTELVRVDVIADGETLEPFEDNTQDFVIANHFLEHCQNPILAFENMYRVLKPSGILFLSIPDKRYTFDVNRLITPYHHLINDYDEGPHGSRRGHYEEWVRLVNKVTDDVEVKRQTDHLMEINYSIHFHVWTETEMIEFFLKQKSTHDFEIELFFRNTNEMIFVLRKA